MASTRIEELETHVASLERRLMSWVEASREPCRFCKGTGTIEVEIYPSGCFDEAYCPCGVRPSEDEDDEGKDGE